MTSLLTSQYVAPEHAGEDCFGGAKQREGPGCSPPSSQNERQPHAAICEALPPEASCCGCVLSGVFQADVELANRFRRSPKCFCSATAENVRGVFQTPFPEIKNSSSQENRSGFFNYLPLCDKMHITVALGPTTSLAGGNPWRVNLL